MPPTMSSSTPTPAIVSDEAGEDEGPLGEPLGEPLGGEGGRRSRPTVAAVKMTPVWMAS